MNRIRCFWLSDNRNIVSKKRKRCVTINNFYVTKNVIDWMQLWNLRQKTFNYNKNIWKITFKMCKHFFRLFNSRIFWLQKFRAFYNYQTIKSSSSKMNRIFFRIQFSNHISIKNSKHQIWQFDSSFSRFFRWWFRWKKTI